MSKILFINPVIREEDDPKHVPYGMAMLAAIANNHGHLVQVYDANAWRLDDDALEKAILADKWDVIATGNITTAYGYIKKIVQFAKKLAPKSKVIAGGGFITSMPRDIMEFLPEIDIGIIGEAYITFPEILNKIDEQSLDLQNIKGIIWKDNKKIKMNPPRELIPNDELDKLPYPAWEMFPLEIYWKNSKLLYSEEAFTSKRRIDINASYGCSLICRFCFHLGISGDMKYTENNENADAVFTYDRNIRWHSPRYIVDLVKYAHEKLGVDFVLFLDENLMTMNAHSKWKWLPEITKLWIEEGLQPTCRRKGIPHDSNCTEGVHWGGTSHATLLKPELLKNLYESGCSQLLYGYESFSNRILKNLGKGTSKATNASSLKLTMESGIRPIPNQMIGFPDEFFDSILECIDAWEELGIQAIPFFATPYPGSEWYYTYKEKILEQYNGHLEQFILDLGDATKITAVISENFNAVELLGLRELMLTRDKKRIKEYEKIWRKNNVEPYIPDFVHDAKPNNSNKYDLNLNPRKRIDLRLK